MGAITSSSNSSAQASQAQAPSDLQQPGEAPSGQPDAQQSEGSDSNGAPDANGQGAQQAPNDSDNNTSESSTTA